MAKQKQFSVLDESLELVFETSKYDLAISKVKEMQNNDHVRISLQDHVNQSAVQWYKKRGEKNYKHTDDLYYSLKESIPIVEEIPAAISNEDVLKEINPNEIEVKDEETA